MKTRIFAMLLAMVMVFSMAATAETQEAVTLHVAMLDSASAEYLEGEDISNNWWTKQYKERFNVEVVTDWSTNDADAYNTKINLAMVSNDLPDTFKVVNLAQLEQLIEAGLLMDVSAVFEEHASDLLKSLCYADEDTFNTGKSGDALYGIAQMHYGWSTQPYYIWLRNDWMQEQNLSAPQTMEELENIMKTFKEAYGAWGIAVDKSLVELTMLAPAWGAYPSIWVENAEGTLEPGNIQPEMKEALAAFAEWFKNGYIDPNFTTYDLNAMNTAAVNGTVGVEVYQQWWGYIPGPDVVKEQGVDAYFTAYEVPMATAEVLYPINFDNNGYTVISKDCEHPEKVIELMNFYAQVYYGEADEGIQEFRDWNLNGYAHITGPFRTTNTRSEDINLEQVTAAIANNDTSYLTETTAVGKYNGSMLWINDKDATGLGDYMQHGAGEHAAFRLANNIISEDRVKLNALWGKSPEIMNMYGSTLDDLLLEGFTKIVIGADDIDSFDTLVANWRAAGGDEVIAAVNEMYK